MAGRSPSSCSTTSPTRRRAAAASSASSRSGAVAVGGIISSDVGLATARVAEELQTPLFLVKAGSEAILTRDSRYTFRTCIPSAPMVAGPIAQYVQQEGLTKVGAIVADYAWGQAIRAALEAAFAELEGVELQIEVAPVPEQDFTTYLRNLEAFGPELLVATGHPPGSGAITVQSADLGLDIPVTGAYSPLAAVVSGAGDAAIGRFSDFDCADYAERRVPGAGPPLPRVLREHVHGGRRRRRLRHRADGRPGGRGGRRRPGGHRRVPPRRDVRPARLRLGISAGRSGASWPRPAAVLA